MSDIEWTTTTWNPVVGCDRVSEGCRNCYAEKMSKRLAGVPHSPQYDDVIGENGTFAGGSVNTVPDKLEEPLHWQKPRRVFVNSMSDLFHPEVPFEFIDKVFAVMALAKDHTFQILTKRPERMFDYLNSDRRRNIPVYNRAVEFLPGNDFDSMPRDMACSRSSGGNWWPLPNVWLGTSVENQETADKRIPPLLSSPASVRFLSCEPLLGPIDLTEIHVNGFLVNSLEEHRKGESVETNQGIDWVITGGESGPGARPSHPDWFRQLRDQCQEAGVPFFFKQHGAWLAKHQAEKRGMDITDKTKRWCRKSQSEIGAEDMVKVGKKNAGRELDGETWDKFPGSAGTKKEGRS